jgi:hypothetical protein
LKIKKALEGLDEIKSELQSELKAKKLSEEQLLEQEKKVKLISKQAIAFAMGKGLAKRKQTEFEGQLE